MSGGAVQRGENGRGARPVVAVSMGDPTGIGAEVIVKALAEPGLRSSARFHVYGCAGAMHAAAERAGIEPYWWRVRHDTLEAETAGVHDVVVMDDPELDADPFGKVTDEARSRGGKWAEVAGPSEWGGRASLAFLERAIGAAKLGAGDSRRAAAVVTAPISKTSWKLAWGGDMKYAGHTELLAERFGSKRTAMMFVGPRLRVGLVTVHVPLCSVSGLLSIGRVFEVIGLVKEACVGLGVREPRIGVCGLNPHAGEEGLMGEEEGRVIEPAMELARRSGIRCTGPHPGDSVFVAALKGEHDAVVAMYHDQGLIPAKVVDRDETVNVTLGLGVVRTSPAHGTAFDIAGKNVADAGSMRAALRLAVEMSSGCVGA